MTLEGTTCVVTGASRGIGRGIAEQLGRRGANVVVNYQYSGEAANDVVEAIEAGNGHAIAVQADVTEREAVEVLREEAVEAFGPPAVLVNNAGITQDTTFEHMSREEWDLVMDVTLGGTFNCTQVFLPDLQDAEEGRLINISSVVGKQGNYGQVNYATAKSGLFGFTRSLALELAPHGSTANCVAPGFTETDMLDDVREDVRERIREQIPLSRFATVEEIACVVAFLASPEASYVTGEIIDVTGAYDL